MMKTTTQMADEEFEYLRDKAYIEAERYEKEIQLMQELFEEENRVKVVIGKVRKRNKLLQYARVTTNAKIPRFLRVQSHNRRIQTAPDFWNRSEPPIYSGMPF